MWGVIELTTAILGRAKGKERTIAHRAVAFLCLGLLAGGCVQSTLEPASDVGLTLRDKKLLANAP